MRALVIQEADTPARVEVYSDVEQLGSAVVQLARASAKKYNAAFCSGMVVRAFEAALQTGDWRTLLDLWDERFLAGKVSVLVTEATIH
jgi:hypothetical protein